MEYNIKEVSNILNISREMIRYYEKKGMISPKRKEEIIIVLMKPWIFFS